MSDEWPRHFKDRLILSNRNSSNAVVTLWTPKETIQKLTDPNSYYVMGQLYTKKGINYILRNILANPVIRNIYLVGNDLMQSGDALLRLFNNGVDEKNKIIGDESAYIDEQIPLEKINLFREKVKIHDYRGSENLKLIKDKISEEMASEAWTNPEIFPEPKAPDVSVFPAEIDLVKIRRSTIGEAYLAVLKHVDLFGLESAPPMNNASSDSNKLKEVLNLCVVVTDENPLSPVIPEYFQFGADDLESYYAGFFNPDKQTEDYTYGERLFNYAHDEIDELKKIYPWLGIDRFKPYFLNGGIDQVEVAIVRKLKSFKHDKGAIALLGNPFTDVFPQRPPKKIPCLFLIQCQIYNNKLYLTAYFRSNDMYNAWPLNAFALRKLQFNIAGRLGVASGALITISNMAHIYEHNFADLKTLVEKYYTGYNCEWDPHGNFIVSVEHSKIIVKLMSPDGASELKSWSVDGKIPLASQELSILVEKDLALSTLGNAMYLGRELERAETSIKLGIKYQQDLPLNFADIQ